MYTVRYQRQPLFAHSFHTMGDFRGSFLQFSKSKMFLSFARLSGPTALLLCSLLQCCFFPFPFLLPVFHFSFNLSCKYWLFNTVYSVVSLAPNFTSFFEGGESSNALLKFIQCSWFIPPTIIYLLVRIAGYFCLSLLWLLTSRR